MSESGAARLESLAAAGRSSLFPDRIKITVGMATCSRAAGAADIYQSILQRIEQRQHKAIVAQTGCFGYCQKEPIVDVRLSGGGQILFTDMNRPRARALVDSLAKETFPGHLEYDGIVA